MTSATSERTPLIPKPGDRVNGASLSGNGSHCSLRGEDKEATSKSWASRIFSVEHRILLAGFLITMAFSYTQVPYVSVPRDHSQFQIKFNDLITIGDRMLYVFHLMTCDVYYDTHPPHQGPGDRCSHDAITAGTATQFSILGMSTTLFGMMRCIALLYFACH